MVECLQLYLYLHSGHFISAEGTNDSTIDDGPESQR